MGLRGRALRAAMEHKIASEALNLLHRPLAEVIVGSRFFTPV
jgi:hypothetical protein